MKKTILLICSICLLISCKKNPQSLSKITAKTIAIDSTITNNDEIVKIISPYKEKMISEINTVISYTSKDLVRTDGNMQSTLGNLLADLCYKVANPIFKEKQNKNIDFSMFNFGGIRAGIPSGKVTNKHAFELMPFENSLLVVELSGDKIIELINYFIANKRAHPLSKHIELVISNDTYSLKINGKSFNKNQTYFVLTSDYLQGGGDRMNFFKNPISLTKLDYKMRHAIIDHFKSTPNLESELDKRIIIK